MTGDLFTSSERRQPFKLDSLGAQTRRGSGDTFCDKVAALFRSRPGEWVDGRQLAEVAGLYGWRTRVSELRRPPYSLNIVNRQRKNGRYTVSEYMLVVATGDGLGGAA